MSLPVAISHTAQALVAGLALLVLALAVSAAIDMPLQRVMLAKRLKMSVQEAKQEQRDSDKTGFYGSVPMIGKLDACWSFGPLEVCATKIASDRIEVAIKLAGVTIGTGELTLANNQICAGANLGVVKANVCISADFPGQKVWVEGEVCTLNFPSGWSCNGFKTILISW